MLVAVRAERATGAEAAALPELVRRARFAGHQVDELGADQGYASAEAYQTLEGLRIAAYIPPQRRMAAPEALVARGVSVKIDRMTHAEGAIGELKNQHALARTRGRGTRKAQIQLLMAATAVNLKRLARYAPAHTAQAAGNPRAAPHHAVTAASHADADHNRLAARLGHHLAAISRTLQPIHLTTRRRSLTGS